jgi:tetraacyldisaccharide 4'-kinase
MIAPKFWNNRGVVSTILLPFSWVYGAIVQFRLRKSGYKSKAKVICVGNVTAGGVGKTPVCMALAEKYISEGKKVCFVTRGYKGKLKNIVVDLDKHSAIETGDEARLLANVATTIISPDRASGAKVAEKLGMDVIIMDDGFQNPSLCKDECVIVFDGKVGIGNGRVLPAGPLRETLKNGEKRATCAIIMGEDKTGLAEKISIPCYFGKVVPEHLDIEGAKVLAFAGIGRPSKFYDTLCELGYDVVETSDFADHYSYTKADIDELIEKAKARGLLLITTEKDFVKLDEEMKKDIHCLKIKAVW